MRSELQAFLKTLHSRVYFQTAPKIAVFPYIVYDFSSTINSGEYDEITMVDITAWDKPSNGDSTVVENLITTINEGLNKKVIEGDGFSVIFYLNSKVYTRDKDVRLKRRLYTYEATKYEGG